jgi:hypothetical protein
MILRKISANIANYNYYKLILTETSFKTAVILVFETVKMMAVIINQNLK